MAAGWQGLCRCHGAHQLFCNDGHHEEFFPKLAKKCWDKQNVLQGVFTKIDNLVPPMGTLTKYGWEFHANWDKYRAPQCTALNWETCRSSTIMFKVRRPLGFGIDVRTACGARTPSTLPIQKKMRPHSWKILEGSRNPL